MEKEPGMKKIDTHVPVDVWKRYEQWVKGRGNIPSRQLHTRLFEMFLALPEHLRLEVLYGKLEDMNQMLAPLNRQHVPVLEDALHWCGMPLTPAWTPAEREHAIRAIAHDLLRRGVPIEQLHATIEAPAKTGQASTPSSPELSPEELVPTWPEDTKQCALAVLARSIPDKERSKLHRVIDAEAAAIASDQADTAS